MRARRLIAAGVLTAATFSSTVAGLAITGTLDKAFAASTPQCNPGPVSGPVSAPVQNPGQQGQNSGQKGQNAQCQPPLTLAALDTTIADGLNGFDISVTNLDSNAAGAAGTETFQTNTSLQSASIVDCGLGLYGICELGTTSGTFTITTNVGTLSGTASGSAEAVIVSETPPPQTVFVGEGIGLTVTSATGSFKGTTGGTLSVLLLFPPYGASNFTGTITG